ncbi:protein DDI1 homolog 2-like [Ostrea edulis]|uniref:protein DDI1 homolog 2-like n=1 Tax=Ostrea edulis TaxID=37623 RepID=UPI0024AF31E3|nr:protein DDI1 homolog 2-like [Ostrea edulis]
MHITVTTLSDQIFALDVSEDLELENFKALCEFEIGISASEMAILWNGRPLHDDKRTLKSYGVKDGDMLLLQHMRGAPQAPQSPQQSGTGVPLIDFGSISIPGQSPGQGQGGSGASGRGQQPLAPDDPEVIRQMLLNSPHELSLLKERNPPLADALLSGSKEKFAEVFNKQRKEKMEREKERMQLMNADPFDPSVQSVIAEEIRMKNVESNMESAIEFAPESFGQVVMLYIDCKVNGHDVKAFVDSGAQMTIMSQACAERCNIMRLVDQRWAGIAKGVGTQKIIGRVHLGQIQIGNDFLQSSFSILEDQPMDMLLGLDMLKRHQCCIDLKKSLLIIGTTGTETRFLSESELPDQARQNFNQPMSPKSQLSEDAQLAEALAKSQDEALKPGPSSSNKTVTPSASVKADFPEEIIQRLMNNGFSRQAVIRELAAANGNADQALASLIAKSFQLPQ